MTSMIKTYTEILKDRYTNQSTARNQERYRTHVRTHRPKGKLIEPDTFSLNKDIESAGYFVKGIQGKGNDYSIGRINDLTLKLGGLGIATTIAVSKGSPIRRGMEFVGLASWLGAMALWPKLAINKPIKHFKGVDLDLEYETSAGHKKKFFNDPQFICWDLMSDEQIHKMGDKLGVPRNIKNRRKAIENKARQVAIQGNTLSLLTAGLATPLIASLVADTVDKRFLSKTVPVVNDARAENMASKLTHNISLYDADTTTIDFINSKVTENTSDKVKEELKAVLNEKTDDKSLRKVISRSVDKIFSGKKVQTADIVLNNELTNAVIKTLGDKETLSETAIQKLKELSQKYNNTLTSKNVGKFFDELEEFLLDHSKMDLEEIRETAIPKTKLLLKKHKIVTLVNPKEIKAQLIHMSQMLDIYNQKVYRDFENGFFKLVGTGEGSVNAKLWTQMGKDVAKALHISNKNLEDIVSNINTVDASGKVIDKTNILGKIFESVLDDPKKLEKTLTDLGRIAENISTQNERHTAFALEYLDKMQHTLSQTHQASSLDNFSQALKILISQQRQKVLKNYIGVNETIFAPIHVINSLSQAKEFAEKYAQARNIDPKIKPIDPKEVYAALKRLIIEAQTTDHFVNKLDVYNNFIKNERDFKEFANIMFSDLTESVRKKLPPHIAEKASNTIQLQKHLFVNLTDGIKLEYILTNSEEAVKTLKATNLYKYADELFDIRFNNPEEVVKTIGAVAQKYDHKLEDLRNIFRLSAEDIKKIKAGDIEPLRAVCLGSWNKGSGYLENGRHNLKSILTYLEIKDLAPLGDISIVKTKIGKATKVAGQDLFSFVKSNAKETLNYNRWFKRVAISFVALCGVTAVALSQIGKKNEFNPDIYQERKKA